MTYTLPNLFSLTIDQKPTNTKILLNMHNQITSTHTLTSTTTILEKLLPSVLSTQCYNPQNLPFSIEVRNTEIGHLFEHILLDYLCQEKLAQGHKAANFSGSTKWNWKKDPKGKFHIYIDCKQKDAHLLPIALNNTINLMKIIVQNNQTTISPYN